MSLGVFTRNGPLSPVITGAIFFALTRGPERYRERLLETLGTVLSATNIGRLITALKWLCVFGLLRNFHIWLSNIAQNNFRLRSERHRYNWPNEVAVVTGAASGFGALISKGLAAQGINVMAVDLRDSAPDDMKVNPRIQYYKCDITDREKVMELAERIRKQYGDPSILINNAGVAYQHTVLTATEKSINNTYNVNIISHYWTLQAFLPAMIANKKGHVVSMASIASFLSGAGMVSYSSTKAAVLALHDGLCAELRSVYKTPEVKFTIVHPTFARTALIAQFTDELSKRGIMIMDPQDVADAVVNQVLSCTGKQLVLGDATVGLLATFRAWPYWLSNSLARLGEGSDDEKLASAERSSSL